jgi:hypothetical protein
LRIIIYEFDNSFTVQSRDFKSYLENRPNLTLLFRKTHYDYVYNDKYFEKHTKELCFFVNIAESLQVIRSNDLENRRAKQYPIVVDKAPIILDNIEQSEQSNAQKCLKCNMEYSNKPNLFGLCQDCLNSDLYNQIMSYYLIFLSESMRLFIEGHDENVAGLYNESI